MNGWPERMQIWLEDNIKYALQARKLDESEGSGFVGYIRADLVTGEVHKPKQIWKRVAEELPDFGEVVLVSDGQVYDWDGVTVAMLGDDNLFYNRQGDELPWATYWADIPRVGCSWLS